MGFSILLLAMLFVSWPFLEIFSVMIAIRHTHRAFFSIFEKKHTFVALKPFKNHICVKGSWLWSCLFILHWLHKDVFQTHPNHGFSVDDLLLTSWIFSTDVKRKHLLKEKEKHKKFYGDISHELHQNFFCMYCVKKVPIVKTQYIWNKYKLEIYLVV